MRKIRFVGLRFVLFGIMWVGIMGLITVVLWNALIPAILGFRPITFWQALGLLLLSRVLLGRFGGWGPRMRKARFVRRWTDLTSDERDRFRRAMGARCAGKFDEGEA